MISVAKGTAVLNSWVPRYARALTIRISNVVELAAFLPPLLMARDVSRGPRLHFSDYWHVLLNITNTDGSLNVGGLFIPQNEHLLAVPAFTYWVNARLFDGDNRILGIAVVGIGCLTVLLLRSQLPTNLPRLVRASLVVLLSSLVFSPHGLHSYVHSMSGIAWLTANLLVGLSLLYAARSRWLVAYTIGIAAFTVYGTALSLWPVLATLALIRRARLRFALFPLLIGGGLVLVWKVLRPGGFHDTVPTDDLATPIYIALTTFGHPWTGTNTGIAVFGGAVMAALLIAVSPHVHRHHDLHYWGAMAAYALMACVVIGATRNDYGVNYALASRYAPISIFGATALAMLLVSWLTSERRYLSSQVAIAVLVVAVLSYAVGAPTAADIRADNARRPVVQATALRTGTSSAFGGFFPPADDLVPRLKAMGLYPFSSNFSLGCGGPDLGSPLNARLISPLSAAGMRKPEIPTGEVDEVKFEVNATRVSGWATGFTVPVLCAVLTDESRTVVGGGASQIPRGDVRNRLPGISPEVGFDLIAPAGAAPKEVVIVLENDEMWSMPMTPSSEKESRG